MPHCLLPPPHPLLPRLPSGHPLLPPDAHFLLPCPLPFTLPTSSHPPLPPSHLHGPAVSRQKVSGGDPSPSGGSPSARCTWGTVGHREGVEQGVELSMERSMEHNVRASCYSTAQYTAVGATQRGALWAGRRLGGAGQATHAATAGPGEQAHRPTQLWRPLCIQGAAHVGCWVFAAAAMRELPAGCGRYVETWSCQCCILATVGGCCLAKLTMQRSAQHHLSPYEKHEFTKLRQNLTHLKSQMPLLKSL